MNLLLDEYGLSYRLNRTNRTASIIAVKENSDKAEIKRVLVHNSKYYLITSIKYNAFSNTTMMKSITFSNDSALTTIGDRAFESSSIESLEIPANLQKLGENWCKKTNYLNNITISPKNQNYIYFDDKMLIGKLDNTKPDYDNLIFVRRDCTDIRIPSFIKRISNYSLEFCKKIETFSIDENSELYSIGLSAFSNSSIKKLTLPKTFTNFDYGWCENTTKLNEIVINKENPNFIVNENLFVLGKSNPNVELFDEIYFAPRSIQKVVIPSYIKTLKPYLFDRCCDIESVEFESNSNLVLIGDYCFSSCQFDRIHIPSSVKSIGKFAFWGSYLSEVYFDDDSKLEVIDSRAFHYTHIREIKIPASVKEIGYLSLSSECLEKVEFQENSKLEIIDQEAFSSALLTQITFPSSLKFVDCEAFSFCYNLLVAEILSDDELDIEKVVEFEHSVFMEVSENFSIFAPKNVNVIFKEYKRPLIFFDDGEYDDDILERLQKKILDNDK